MVMKVRGHETRAGVSYLKRKLGERVLEAWRSVIFGFSYFKLLL
jgi:hypothetical protein